MAKYNYAPKGKGHFFASSVAEFKTDVDAEKLIKFMKAGKFSFNLWFIPLPIEASYDVNRYAPDINEAILIGGYTLK